MYYPTIKNIKDAKKLLQTILKDTPLELHNDLSLKHNTNVYLKREDLTPVRSYKIRGAYNKMFGIPIHNSIVTCSAGNHAQGVAYSCKRLGIKGNIFMPTTTPQQKIKKVEDFGKEYINIVLQGKTFDECYNLANTYAIQNSLEFIHPFDDAKVIEGQGTVGLEILEQLQVPLDYIFLPIGGGGLAAGVSAYIREMSPHTKIIGVEPSTAASMFTSILQDTVVTLDKISTFVDGASVKKVGNLNFSICRKNLDRVLLIDEGHVCSKILQMYNESGYIIEPAGVLTLCALDILNVKNKNVVCVISGGNSDVFRMPEILERSLIYEGRKHYFRIEFPQKAGSLKNFIMNVLGENDDIIYFRYTKVINKEMGPVILGIETSKEDITILLNNMKKHDIMYEILKHSDIY